MHATAFNKLSLVTFVGSAGGPTSKRHTDIYIYIYREREREREGEKEIICMCIYIYIERERC